MFYYYRIMFIEQIIRSRHLFEHCLGDTYGSSNPQG